MGRKKILLAGSWTWKMYEEALAIGFEENGYEVIPFKFSDYIFPNTLRGRIHHKLLFGPDVIKLNEELLNIFIKSSPDIIFLNRAIFVWVHTLRKMRELKNVIIITYNNDNPFAYGKWSIWRNYLKSIQISDFNFFYRKSNLEYANSIGISGANLLLPYYVEGLHRPIKIIPDKYKHDVVFIGHYEDDGRSDYIEYLINHRIDIHVYGTRWNELSTGSIINGRNIFPLYEKEYIAALSGAKIALAFLSKRNKDTYTRRNFEIPACGTLMISQETNELKNIYKDGEEAVFFRSKKELLEKARFYLENENIRLEIAKGGYEKCIQEHSNIHRAQEILLKINKNEQYVSEN